MCTTLMNLFVKEVKPFFLCPGDMLFANYRHSRKKIDKIEFVSWYRSLYDLECKIL